MTFNGFLHLPLCHFLPSSTKLFFDKQTIGGAAWDSDVKEELNAVSRFHWNGLTCVAYLQWGSIYRYLISVFLFLFTLWHFEHCKPTYGSTLKVFPFTLWVCTMFGIICKLIRRAWSLFFKRQKHGHTSRQSNINVQAFIFYVALLFVCVYVFFCCLVKPTLRNICCLLHTHCVIHVLCCLHKLDNLFWLTASCAVVTLLLLKVLFVACRVMWEPFTFCVCTYLCRPRQVKVCCLGNCTL